MKHSIIIMLFLLTLNYSCSSYHIKAQNQKKEKIESVKNTQDSLAFELSQIYGLDQGIRLSEGFPNKMKLIQSVDTLNFNRIIKFIQENGVPTKEIVGNNYKRECVQMAFISVMLHNPHRLVNEEKYFNILLNEVKEGRLKKEIFATILDKYYWTKSRGKDVMYGSQFGRPCIQHKEETNNARLKIGLKILPDSMFIDCIKK